MQATHDIAQPHPPDHPHPHEHDHEHSALERGLIAVGLVALLIGGVVQLSGSHHPLLGQLCAGAGAAILGVPVIASALANLGRGERTLHELVALSIAAGLGFGHYLAAGALALFHHLDEVVNHGVAHGARSALGDLVASTPVSATLVDEGGAERSVPAAELVAGQRVRLRPGDRVPADGVIASGRSTLEEKLITGEALPVDKATGDEIYAGTINLSGALEVVVQRAGEETTLARVRELIGLAEANRPPLARMIDEIVASYLPITVGLAATVLFFTSDATRFMAFLVALTPSALVLATPSATIAALSAAARQGILVKDAKDLEVGAKLTHVILDKTGTVTRGELSVVRLAADPARDPARLLLLACSAAAGSRHPASRALVELGREAELEPLAAEELRELPGLGLEARVAGRELLLGRAELLEQGGVALGDFDADLREGAATLIFLAVDGLPAATFALADEPRPEAAATVAELKERGIVGVALVTGDRWPVARDVAQRVGCDDVAAEVLPGEKLQIVERLRASGARVAVVGDGVNDAPALAAADLGIAMGGAGSDVALESARVALLSDDLSRVAFLVRLSRSLRRNVAISLSLAIGFMILGVALTSTGVLGPVPAMILHTVSDFLVLLNAARLFREGEELLAPVEDPSGLAPLAPAGAQAGSAPARG